MALDLKQTTNATLTGNIFAGAGSAAVRLDVPGAVCYSDYNNYQDAAQCWEIARDRRSLRELQPLYERYSHTLAPELRVEKRVPRLTNEGRFHSLGPHSTAFCECIRGKAHQTLLELGPEVRESNNCFYMRWPEDEKLAIMKNLRSVRMSIQIRPSRNSSTDGSSAPEWCPAPPMSINPVVRHVSPPSSLTPTLDCRRPGLDT